MLRLIPNKKLLNVSATRLPMQARLERFLDGKDDDVKADPEVVVDAPPAEEGEEPEDEVPGYLEAPEPEGYVLMRAMFTPNEPCCADRVVLDHKVKVTTRILEYPLLYGTLDRNKNSVLGKAVRSALWDKQVLPLISMLSGNRRYKPTPLPVLKHLIKGDHSIKRGKVPRDMTVPRLDCPNPPRSSVDLFNRWSKRLSFRTPVRNFPGVPIFRTTDILPDVSLFPGQAHTITVSVSNLALSCKERTLPPSVRVEMDSLIDSLLERQVVSYPPDVDTSSDVIAGYLGNEFISELPAYSAYPAGSIIALHSSIGQLNAIAAARLSGHPLFFDTSQHSLSLIRILGLARNEYQFVSLDGADYGTMSLVQAQSYCRTLEGSYGALAVGVLVMRPARSKSAHDLGYLMLWRYWTKEVKLSKSQAFQNSKPYFYLSMCRFGTCVEDVLIRHSVAPWREIDHRDDAFLGLEICQYRPQDIATLQLAPSLLPGMRTASVGPYPFFLDIP
jgi:hypothetical protein